MSELVHNECLVPEQLLLLIILSYVFPLSPSGASPKNQNSFVFKRFIYSNGKVREGNTRVTSVSSTGLFPKCPQQPGGMQENDSGLLLVL